MTKAHMLAATTASLAILAMQSTPAFAQTATGEATNKADAGFIEPASADANAASDTIVVTGSRIATPNQTSSIPITSISGEQFLSGSGSVSLGDKLNDLPSLRTTYGQQNGTRNLGTSGLNLLDLRGLGTARTLVLVNGRRHVASDILVNGVSVDINTIPEGLLERVDVVTGGLSSIYGSDAIGGVVNFILKDKFDGIELNARSGVSTYGDAGAYQASLVAGRNFSEGRGNVALDLEYNHQSPYFASNRPNLAQTNAFVTVDTDAGGSVNGSDGIPDRVFLRDVRSTTLANTGLLQFASPTGACGRDASTNATPNAAFRCTYLFSQDGTTLVPETGQRVGVAPNGSFVGGNGDTRREFNLTPLSPKQDRYIANLIAHYEITPALVPFVEAKYVRNQTSGAQGGPAFIQGTTLAAFGYSTVNERVRLDNPFLSTQARSIISPQVIGLINSNINPQTQAAYATTAAGIALRASDLAAANAGSYRINLFKNLYDLGVRNEANRRETFRIVGGLRGDFGDGWHYEVAGNYGKFKERNEVQGNINIQRFLLAMDSQVSPTTGQVVCRSQVTAAEGQRALNPTTQNQAILASDIAACVPFNPFGIGTAQNALARNYILANTVSIARITQQDYSGYVSGDSSKWFELPGGPIGISIGAEYRRETNYYKQSALGEQNYTFYNAIPTFSSRPFIVKEAYGELRVPLLRDLPFIKELTANGSGRVSKYKGATGTVYTYNGAIAYAPVEDLRFRANYSRSVRAPNLSELYSEQSANFATVVDPCSLRNIATGSATRAAACAAAGIPASYDYVYTQSLAIRSGGNPDLTAETSKSYSFGGVITPRWIRGLTVTVDYYNVTVNKVITSVTAQNILNSCYDLAAGNPFCSLFQRAGASGGPGGEQQYRIIENSLLQSVLNFAKLKVRGIDLDVAYRHRFDGIGEVTLHGVYTHSLQQDQFVNPADPARADRLRGELGNPIDAFNVDVAMKRGILTLGYQLRFIGHMALNTWEDTHSVQGRPPENLDYADRQFYPNVYYHAVRAALDVSRNFNIYVGVDNLLNRKQPFDATGIGAGSGIYDVRGRYFYTGIKASL